MRELYQLAFHYLAQIYPTVLRVRKKICRNVPGQCENEAAIEMLERFLKTSCKKATGEYIFKTLLINCTFLS